MKSKLSLVLLLPLFFLVASNKKSEAIIPGNDISDDSLALISGRTPGTKGPCQQMRLCSAQVICFTGAGGIGCAEPNKPCSNGMVTGTNCNSYCKNQNTTTCVETSNPGCVETDIACRAVPSGGCTCSLTLSPPQMIGVIHTC